MNYLLKQKGRWYFNRRVPEEVRLYDRRERVRVALKTDSKDHARRKAVILNEQIEAYWQSLITDRQQHHNDRFRQAVCIARKMGFSYQPISVVASLPIMELLQRVLALNGSPTESQADAILGAKPVPDVTVSEALEKFWDLAKDQVLEKSEFQIRKWKNPRRKAVQDFIALRDDLSLKSITRDDIMAFQHWWLERIKEEKKNADTANKSLLYLRTILETVSGHLKLGLDIEHLFKKILLRVRRKQKRLPFSSDQIRAILHSEHLDKMHPESKWFLYMIAETGARPSELVALTTQDIRLDDSIPHICITAHEDSRLKTEHSERKIPLVGYALDAFRQMPDGFTHYRHKSDILTTAINKFLRSYDLLPSKQHTCYSFRHSFQDRILSVNTPDRVQAELMGHKFSRPLYGDGATLKQKLHWMRKCKLKQ